MPTVAIYSQPLLGLRTNGGDSTDDGSSSSGELRGGVGVRPPRAPRRRRSCGDIVPLGDGGGGVKKPRHGNGGGGDDEPADTFLHLHNSPGYVSFEDVIGTAAFPEESGRPPEAGISDPLVRTASRLYACEAVKPPPPPRQRSPGPLGTRRGSAMHRLVKKYVHPFFGFVKGIFCCGIPS